MEAPSLNITTAVLRGMGLGFWVEGLLSPKARKRQTNPLESLCNHNSYIRQRLEHKKEATQSGQSIRATFLSGSTSEVLNGT